MSSAAATEPHVLVVGGGVAGLEAVLALRAIAGRRVRVTLVANAVRILDRPATVAEPFDRAPARSIDVHAFGRELGLPIRYDRLVAVHPGRHVATFAGCGDLDYDALLVATGASFGWPPPGTTPFRGERDVPAVRHVIGQLREGLLRRVAFVVPDTASWTLPLYELALMAGADLHAARPDAELVLVTPEPAPLAVFGPAASAALEPLLRDRGVEMRCGVRAVAFADGELLLEGGGSIAAEQAISVAPPLARPPLGLPRDGHGFVPVDEHGRVLGLEDVYAAGDVTDGALKQGGLAAQQADAAAAAIAARLGLAEPHEPAPPVARGVLLVGGEPLYLRAELADHRSAVAAGASEATARPLWKPPAKVAARYLAPYLSTARPLLGGTSALVDLPGPRAHA